MDEFNKHLLRDFIADNWDSWAGFCEERGEDPENIYVNELDGEPE